METSTLYDKYYTEMDETLWHWRELSGAIKARNIIAQAHSLPIQRLLDIGSGTGSVIAHLAKFNFAEEYYAIDIVEEAMNILCCRTDIHALVEAKVFDGSHIPYADQTFDMAVLSHVVEHLSNPVILIQEAVRVAKFVLIEVPLENNLHTLFKVNLFKSKYREEIGHVQWFDKKKLRKLLSEECKVEIVHLGLVCLPDEVYLFQKTGIRRIVSRMQLSVRKAVRWLLPTLYPYLLTDHCIALVQSRKESFEQKQDLHK